MQVAAGRAAGRAHLGDLLPRGDARADRGVEAGQVGVARHDALAVVDLDDIAVTRAAADERHAARRRGEDRGAERPGEIEPGVHRARAGEGIVAIAVARREHQHRSEEHTSELQSLMRISYAVFCLKKKNKTDQTHVTIYSSDTAPHVNKTKVDNTT